MLSQDRSLRFARMERDAARLRARFKALTSAHGYFHEHAALKSVSVSDALVGGSIDAIFLDVRIRFQLLMIFGDDFEPRGRVVCMHCHTTYGYLAQESLGGFTFDAQGMTDLAWGIDGQGVALDACAPQIILMFLEKAFGANRCL
ncbi:MAG: hypothetical protein JWR40_276 [Massilia sp.]|jgi:hypothetical protein|nr:hypothetical protein [Massilia sp.]MDB5948428.1 hypothetical protein [Massilia sp.]